MDATLRKCVVCSARKPKADLVRVGAEPWSVTSGEVKCNGRGAYVCRAGACIERAKDRKSIDRSLRVSVPDEVYGRIESFQKECH